MEVGGSPTFVLKRIPLTPKAIINQRFPGKAIYKIEEVQEPPHNECPGLAIPQKGPCLYRCCLQLLDFSVLSDAFKRKKEAEQSAAKMALEKLGISATADNPSERDPWEDLVSRLSYLFSPKFLTSSQPLSGHFRAALRREGQLRGLVPISVIPIYDARINNLCKSISPEVETNPLLAMPLILKAAAKLPGSVYSSGEKLSLKKKKPYPLESIQSVIDQQQSFSEFIQIEAVRIPCSLDKAIEILTISVPLNGYYLDSIARELGLEDACKVFISRPIGKASSEMRLYFCAPRSCMWDQSKAILHAKQAVLEGSLNARASFLSGDAVHGDAILASIGYTWNSADIFYENVSMQTYYRTLIGKTPSGIYKLSREATVAAELPRRYTTRTNWAGSFPKDILHTFCHKHRLAEPEFSTINKPPESLPKSPGSCNKLKFSDSNYKEICSDSATCEGHSVGSGERFRCEVKIFSRSRDPILESSPKESFKKQSDAVQNAALKVLSWFDKYFTEREMSVEELTICADAIGIQFYPHNFLKESALVGSVHSFWQISGTQRGKLFDSNSLDALNVLWEEKKCLVIEGSDSGVLPSHGSLVCISYTISLVTEGELKELLESSEEFEFEIGNGAVLPCLEAVVTQMSEGQSACFHADLPPQELILATAGDSSRVLSLLSTGRCNLQYSTTLLRVTEPLEDRIEQALFSPPLSKQRVEFALQYIKGSQATCLVDFGCGSGSLLDSLLDQPTLLEKIVGVDLSRKSLARAAKILHSKLSKQSDGTGVTSALLYYGSITVFDSHLYGFDIGTCLEVIEHMEEEEACLFGDIVLGSFCPRILIVSTPNYEYNVIIQRSSLQGQEDEADEKNQTRSCKFRNLDHKFEWTREQFSHWAIDLATKHNYSVEFSGVGGDGNEEPGFASQIGVFKRIDDLPNGLGDATHVYKVMWEWSNIDGTRTST